MSSAESTHAGTVALPLRSLVAARLADFAELSKPRIAVMGLVAVAVGYTLASGGTWQFESLAMTLAGIGCVAVASSAFNQVLERKSDARMERTAGRPLPSGRLSVAAALAYAAITAAVGLGVLALFVNGLTALLAVATILLYVCVYTPLKRVTSLCTVIGAIPGALPPVLGWTAAGGQLDSGALVLFSILFLWQFPHFLAIAWLYQDDYARAGLRMLPAVRRSSGIIGLVACVYALALLPVSLLPGRVALAGHTYTIVAAILGVAYLMFAVRFMLHEGDRAARRLLWSSLVYLPLLLFALTWNYLQLLQ